MVLILNTVKKGGQPVFAGGDGADRRGVQDATSDGMRLTAGRAGRRIKVF